ncbi:MAG: GTP-binding protein LepA [Parcubacteria group bacterium Gr01-1014_24]|nr:MAG: GTP-binding protein LepA [Parcubacteria group bacterium Gr01-1014_24]
MKLENIRNFSIIAHIDHGKSTLADRMLEITHTIETRKMRDQVLDSMELERERGITIKMQPVRMVYHARGQMDLSQTNADKIQTGDLLYKDITYKIRGAAFAVKKSLGLGHKEIVYQKALEIEFNKIGLNFESQKTIDVLYDNQKVGTYIPDFVIEEKIIIELKSLPEIGKPQEEQLWSYLKGSKYQLALLINFGSSDVTFKRIVYESLRQSASSQRGSAQVEDEYILNLIDTPGHVDFSYEVSRALKAVEGSILLVDSTQGVQAQTLTTLAMARLPRLAPPTAGQGRGEEAFVIIPVISKIDSPLARISEVKDEVVKLLNCLPEEVLLVSGRTGEGVEALLNAIIERVPPPTSIYSTQNVADGIQRDSASSQRESASALRALVFDFKYSNHRGVIVFVRVLDGQVKKGENLIFAVADEKFTALEVGTFSPEETPGDFLSAGDIGYIVTGIKKPGIASVGDTITKLANPLPALAGYMQPRPVVWASLFPENAPARTERGSARSGGDNFSELKLALGKLRLSDSSFSYEEESSGSLGRGFRLGFLGMLHLEIITERLRREFNLSLIITTPSIVYEVVYSDGKKQKIYSPYFFPDDGNIKTVFEPWVTAKIITPVKYLGNVMRILFDHEAEIGETENFGDNRSSISIKMPLRELMRNFFDELKSTSSGYGSISYNIAEMREANVTRLDILVADEIVTAFSKVISKKRVEEETEKSVEKLESLLPRQMFTLKIQGRALGRIISSRTLSGMKKDVTAHMYGGDITRKMKLREKQKKGKKKMKERGQVNIPPDVFLKMMSRP